MTCSLWLVVPLRSRRDCKLLITGHNLCYPLLTRNILLLLFSAIDTGSHKLQEFKRLYFIETPLLPAASMSEINDFHKTLPELTVAFSINALKNYFGGKCLERVWTELSRIKVFTESTDF